VAVDDLQDSVDERGARRWNPWPLGALSALVIVVAVASTLVLRGDPEPPVTGITVPSGGNQPGSAAPDFSVDLIGGGSFSLSDHLAADGRPVLLNLWASWCGPCRAEMPHLDAAARDNPGVYFLGVAVEDDPTSARQFAAEIGVDYPLAIDEGDVVGRRYPSFGLPATYLIGGDGTIVRTVYGQVTEAQIAELLTLFE
jgi:thiol-disulfide isomerase/thioredoxin